MAEEFDVSKPLSEQPTIKATVGGRRCKPCDNELHKRARAARAGGV